LDKQVDAGASDPGSRRSQGANAGAVDSARSPFDPGCVFCPGNERLTPPEHVAVRQDGIANGPDWRVRAVPNRYPAVLADLDDRPGGLPRPGFGVHDVIVERPEHRSGLSDLTVDQLADVLAVWGDRLASLRRTPGLAAATLFRNQGARAGASQEHAHSQLIATAELPPRLARVMAGAVRHLDDRGACAWCRMIERELTAGERIVAVTRNFIAFCPYASRFAMETWILPRRHVSRFEDLVAPLAGRLFRSESAPPSQRSPSAAARPGTLRSSPGEASDDSDAMELAGVVREVVRRVERALPEPALNLLVATSPFQPVLIDGAELDESAVERSFHAHLAIVPRVHGIAGFELASDLWINPWPPEWSARKLRNDDGLAGRGTR
jgi:UDPglucose--hexose-1-phosphate uridylyltransferase